MLFKEWPEAVSAAQFRRFESIAYYVRFIRLLAQPDTHLPIQGLSPPCMAYFGTRAAEKPLFPNLRKLHLCGCFEDPTFQPHHQRHNAERRNCRNFELLALSSHTRHPSYGLQSYISLGELCRSTTRGFSSWTSSLFTGSRQKRA